MGSEERRSRARLIAKCDQPSDSSFKSSDATETRPVSSAVVYASEKPGTLTDRIQGHVTWGWIIAVYFFTCFLYPLWGLLALWKRQWISGFAVWFSFNELVGKNDRVMRYLHQSQDPFTRMWRAALYSMRYIYHEGSEIVVEDPSVLEVDESGWPSHGPENPPVAFTYHPHGILPMGHIYLIVAQAIPPKREVHVMAASFLSKVSTALRIALSPMAVIEGSTKSAIQEVMHARRDFFIIPGGFEEATLTCQGKAAVYMKKRKGLIKYALQYGYSLCPCYGFGENELYFNAQGGESWRLKLNRFGCPAIAPWGRWFIFPRRVPIMVVVGAPVAFPRIENPTREDIDKWHEHYCSQLDALYERNLPRYRALLQRAHDKDSSREKKEGSRQLPDLWRMAQQSEKLTYHAY